MAKDKKKKKKDADTDIDALMKEWQDGVEMVKAKNEQLDGIIREVKVYLNEIKEMRDRMSSLFEPLDNE